MFGRLPYPRPQRLDDLVYLSLGIGKTEAGVDDEIGALALHRIGHLTGQYRLELSLRHLAAGHDALPLHIRRRCNHSYYIGPLVAAGFEQQRDVEDDDVRLVRDRFFQKGAVGLGDDGMDDALELFHRIGIFRDLAAQLGAVDPAVFADDPRKRPLDGRNGLAARRIGGVNRSVGVVHGDAARSEHRRGGRFTHADGACEGELDHARAATASLQALSAEASSGEIPNQMRKAAAACPTNMGSPS